MPAPIAASILQAIADGPAWLDWNKTLKAMTPCKCGAFSQVCCDNFDQNAKKSYYKVRYKEAFKHVMLELSAMVWSGKKKGKRGCGAWAIAVSINKTMLTSLNDIKLKHLVLHNAQPKTAVNQVLS